MSTLADNRPLVMHVLFRFETGGLEQVLLDTIVGLSDDYRHVVVSLTTVSSIFSEALPEDVEVFALGKRDGHEPRIWITILRLMRSLKPRIVHTYNFACLEFQILAFVCRVPLRVHAEHGWSASDPKGQNVKHRFIRRRMRFVIHTWIAVSKDLGRWLSDEVGVADKHLALVYNGVDIERYQPRSRTDQVHSVLTLEGFCSAEALVVGTVGRLDPVKNQEMLVRLWPGLQEKWSFDQKEVVLAIVGGGALESELKTAITKTGLTKKVWLPGMRSDIKELIPRFDIFLLPSIAEGLPMTLLEAMACARPVIASKVGGIPELVADGAGWLLAYDDAEAWQALIYSSCADSAARECVGATARKRVVEKFGLSQMLNNYAAIYEGTVAIRPVDEDTSSSSKSCVE